MTLIFLRRGEKIFIFHPHTSTDCNLKSKYGLSMLDHDGSPEASIPPLLNKMIVSRDGPCLSFDEPFIQTLF